ncbi:hypothetical protein [Streptomyces kebangsaanensis]|uniref:hypothetical protein n=1 Tax=Streptomyces kebangsaanensis TaxID=864058 RepID=UPI00130149C6|nr:hypothetical protein [Streptomyces kebangsaanensis]
MRSRDRCATGIDRHPDVFIPLRSRLSETLPGPLDVALNGLDPTRALEHNACDTPAGR